MTEPMILRARVAAPLPAVRDALTNPETLQAWLAEKANVDLPNTFEFWGRSIPEGDAPHQRLLHVDDRSLKFNWLLDGVDTTVEISLEPESDDSTIIVLSQSHFDMAEAMDATASIRGVLQTFWCMSIANLVDLLEGRELTYRPDFTDAEMATETVIDAPLHEVYESLIDGQKVTAWFGVPIDIEAWVGGRYAMGGFDSGYAAKVVDIVPDQKVSVDWGAGAGVTSWELADSGGKTRLTFVQSGFDPATPPYAGWLGSVSGLAELRRFHELENWRPIWIQDVAA
jgi:uncharacterized protein YndB with AHSA1/START domain